MATAPGIRDIGSFKLSINRNGSVVIWCHKTWIPAANASRHFATWQGYVSPEHQAANGG